MYCKRPKYTGESQFPEKFESSSLAQVAFAVAILSTRYNGGSFGADFSRSKLKCRRRHEQDDRVTCVNSFVSFATFVCFSHGSKDHKTHCRNWLYFEFWEYLKLWPKKLLRIREAMFVFVLPCAILVRGATLSTMLYKLNIHLLCWTHAAPFTRNSKVHQHVNTAPKRIMTRLRMIFPAKNLWQKKKHLPTAWNSLQYTTISRDCCFPIYITHESVIFNQIYANSARDLSRCYRVWLYLKLNTETTVETLTRN